jgi:hypothetical protein
MRAERGRKAVKSTQLTLGWEIKLMRAFWMTYALAATSLFFLCAAFLGNVLLDGTWLFSFLATAFALRRSRARFEGAINKFAMALLAAVCGVAGGFILVFSMCFAHEFFH